jgi:methyl-galactoside transport system substrate-binding protein
LTAIVVFTAIFLSCGQSGKEKPKIGVAMRSFDDPSSVSIRRAIETEALDKADLAVIDGQGQQAAQNLQIDSFFERKLGALAIAPVDGSAMAAIIAKAKDQITPIVFFDRRPPDEAMRSWDKLFFVGTRESDAGYAEGQMLADYWKANPAADRNKDGTMQYAWIGPASASRAEGFAKALNSAGIKNESIASIDPTVKAEGDSFAYSIRKLSDKVEAVICTDESSALGTIDALKAVGFFKGKKSIPVVGSGEGNLSPAISEVLSSGTLLGFALADAENQGKAVFALSYALARGRDATRTGWLVTDAKYVWVPYQKLSKESFAAPKK